MTMNRPVPLDDQAELRETSNRLPVLAEEIKSAHAETQAASTTAAERALDAGRLLIEAKALVRHGWWLPFLEDAGIAERTARRYMALARTGLQIGHVADLGVTTIARWAGRGERLWPEPGHAYAERLDEDETDDMAFAWWFNNGGFVTYACCLKGSNTIEATRPFDVPWHLGRLHDKWPGKPEATGFNAARDLVASLFPPVDWRTPRTAA